MDTTPNSRGAMVIWLTGLSGAGKTTIAQILAEHLKKQNKQVELLDGDVIRSVFPQTGFTRSERTEHIKRVAFTASRLQHHGINVIVSLISPYEDSRLFAKTICSNFLEVYLSTPLVECQRRDPKGLYKKYGAGTIKNMSGLDEPYEQPVNPAITIDTSYRLPHECAAEIIKAL
jgi:adenylylsulfate kinase